MAPAVLALGAGFADDVVHHLKQHGDPSGIAATGKRAFDVRNTLLARVLLGQLAKIRGTIMSRPLVAALFAVSMMPLYALAQQPDMAKLKADAQQVVSIITEDKAKSQAYCQVLVLSDELDQVDPHKDPRKTEDLSQKIDNLQKKLGPEYLALIDAIKDVNPDSKDGQEIASMFAMLDQSCP